MASLTHMLWFDTEAEEAARHYLEIFPKGKINGINKGPDGKVFTVDFEILNQNYVALNGGPHFKHNEAFSIVVHCDGQEEVDHYWNAFINAGGEEGQCAWLKDKFGVSWQIVPKQLMECLGHPDPAAAGRTMQAMMGMKKIIVADLEAAVTGE